MVLSVQFQRQRLFQRQKQGTPYLFLTQNFNWLITGHGQNSSKEELVMVTNTYESQRRLFFISSKQK